MLYGACSGGSTPDTTLLALVVLHVARRTSDAQLPRVIICLEEIGRTRFTQHQTKVINVVALFSLFAHFVASLW